MSRAEIAAPGCSIVGSVTSPALSGECYSGATSIPTIICMIRSARIAISGLMSIIPVLGI